MTGSPILATLGVDAVAARLDAAGDAEAAALLRALREAVERQDDALRDFVADARHLAEESEEYGTYTNIHGRANGFDELAAAFGYPPVDGRDPVAYARETADPDGPHPYAGMVHLSGLEHLLARISMEGGNPEDLLAHGFVAVEIGHGPHRETLYHHPGGQDPVPGLKP